MKKRRLFVALRLSEELIEKISHFRSIHDDLDVDWIEDEDLHLTLVPPWYEDDVNGVINNLESLSGFGEVDLFFGEVILGPDDDRPYMLWLDVEDDGVLESLRDRCHDVLDIDLPDRDFRPHVTLARFHEDLELPEFTFAIDSVELFESLVLMESHINDERGKYETVHEIEL